MCGGGLVLPEQISFISMKPPRCESSFLLEHLSGQEAKWSRWAAAETSSSSSRRKTASGAGLHRAEEEDEGRGVEPELKKGVEPEHGLGCL